MPSSQEAKGIATAASHKCELPNLQLSGTIEQMSAGVNAYLEALDDYGECSTEAIGTYRRPGANADSTAPDEIACAHAASEVKKTEAIRSYAQICERESNARVQRAQSNDAALDCYPDQTITPLRVPEINSGTTNASYQPK